MDYLVYVEQDAEPLQFFLWYCDYVDRWAKLSWEQKALSPIWDGSSKTNQQHIRYSHRRANSERMSKILKIMGKEAKDGPEPHVHLTRPSLQIHGRSQSVASLSASHGTLGAQPFKDEVMRVRRHYIMEHGPRQLKLSSDDRYACVAAVEFTTHPSALLPAFLVVESALSSRVYPRFIKWSLANSNPPRLVFLRVAAMVLLLVGLGICATLILSCANRFVRVVSLVVWWPGITLLIAAHRGLSIRLQLRYRRDVRPWEQFGDEEEQVSAGKDLEKEIESTPPPTPTTHKTPEFAHLALGSKSHPDPLRSHRPTHGRTDTTTSFSRVDPLRKASMTTLGPANDPRSESWVGAYAAKPLLRKVFEETVQNENRSLQELQERAVFVAVVAGGVVATLLAVGSLFIPSAESF
jgi:hypothetical protein